MAFYDNPRFLLSHIRHSFITCDESGMCEMVMLHEVIPRDITPLQLSLAVTEAVKEDREATTPTTEVNGEDGPISGDILEDDGTDSDLEEQQMIASILDHWDMSADCDLFEGGQSLDIVSDMELIGAHRARSNTAQRLERLKNEKKTQAKVKVVQWKEGLKLSQNHPELKMADLFPKKVIDHETLHQPKVSALVEQLKRLPNIPNNPFNEYARFDGKMSQNIQKKRILIFLTMMPEDVRNYPMEVVTLTTAKVQDLIGLICWQYTREAREPKLKPNPANYCLRIAEESGEVDRDFPSLESKEPVAKFDFPVLALVQREQLEEAGNLVTVHIEEVFSRFEVDPNKIILREVLDQTLRRRKGNFSDKGLDCKLEKFGEPGIYLDLSQPLLEAGTMEFNLVWDDTSESEDEVDNNWNHQEMEAPLFQSYEATLIQKIGRNSHVQLGISGEKVEVNPVSSRSGAAKFLERQLKAVVYDVDQIAACEMITYKHHSGKGVFKLVHQVGEEFKSHVFEAETRKAQEIVRKMHYILQMRSNPARREYLAWKEIKQNKKQLASISSIMK